MCGIAGFSSLSHTNYDLEELAYRFSVALAHRGPDSSGKWIDRRTNNLLVHRRLSIQDLSPLGDQPMVSSNGRYVISFNGEIYNYQQLSLKVRDYRADAIVGSSDTASLLEHISCFGLTQTLSVIDGMFAFSLLDRNTNTIHLCRDAFGEKPLYYYLKDLTLIYSSEIDVISSLPFFSKTLSTESVAHVLRRGCVPAPLSIYSDIYKLMPGSLLSVDLSSFQHSYTQWSDLNEIIHNEVTSSDKELSFADQLSLTKSNLESSVRSRLTGDVAVGTMLSGGLDSSLITSIASNYNSNLQTFSLGFDEPSYDESAYARKIAKYLGTEHNELIISYSDLPELVTTLPSVYGEPFGDSSALPTLAISRLISDKVKVVLSGDGGDELFGGYNRYIYAPPLLRLISLFPQRLSSSLFNLLGSVPSHQYDKLFKKILRFFPASMRFYRIGDDFSKLLSLLNSRNDFELYSNLTSQWRDQLPLLHPDSSSTEKILESVFRSFDSLSYADKMLASDTLTYLPDDILCKTDRASMAYSLEVRSPFLNPHLFRHAWRLPLRSKIRATNGKFILRKLLSDYLPVDLFDRPKTGFGMPISKWLRTDLHDWAKSLISDTRGNPYVDNSSIQKMFDIHSTGINKQYALWNALMFLQWLQHKGL